MKRFFSILLAMALSIGSACAQSGPSPQGGFPTSGGGGGGGGTQFLNFGIQGVVSAGVSRSMVPGMGANGVNGIAGVVCPRASTVKSMYLNTLIAPGAGVTDTFTIMKNNVSTGTSVSLVNTATTNNVTGLNISFAAGDVLGVQIAAGGSSTDNTVSATVEVQ